jgi:hypothetical protein
MDKNGNLENGIRVEMDYFDLVGIKESVEDVAGRKAKSALEERGKHHHLGRIGCRNAFSSSRMPLQLGVIGEKVICSDFADFTFIHDGQLKKVWM